MLKKTIVYEDYNEQTQSEDFYFNLNKSELVELELSEKGGFAEALQELAKSEDTKAIVETFKKLILMSLGQKSLDGKRFIKTPEMRDEFSQTEAYSNLFVELATNTNAAIDFINGIVPAGMNQKVADIPTLPTASPQLAIDPNGEENAEVKKPQEMSREELLEAFKDKLDGKSSE